MGESENILIENIEICKIEIFDLEDSFYFGKFKGKLLSEVIELKPSYIIFCLLKLGFFSISDNAFNKLKSKYLNLSSKIDEKRKIKILIKQQQDLIDEKEYYAWERKSEFLSGEWDNYDYDDFYNDKLDMDQQSEDFYNTVIENEYDNDYDDGNDDFYEDEGVYLLYYALKLQANEISLFKDKNNKFFVEIYNEYICGEAIVYEKILVKDELINVKITDLYVFKDCKTHLLSTRK